MKRYKVVTGLLYLFMVTAVFVRVSLLQEINNLSIEYGNLLKELTVIEVDNAQLRATTAHFMSYEVIASRAAEMGFHEPDSFIAP